MTSQELAEVAEAAERRWFSTALRVRLFDHERMTWKRRFMARAVSLFAHYARVGWQPTRTRRKRS